MGIKFYTDAHIAKTIATQLRAKGVDCIHCAEVRRENDTDLQHLEYSTQEGRVILTHDSDFLKLHSEWQLIGKSHAGIMYCLQHLQGKEHAGVIINICLEYSELIEAGAGTIENDIANRVIFVG